MSGESETIAWTEYSVPEIGDVTDRKRWAACNPALGRRMRERTVAAECEQMSADTFARERLDGGQKKTMNRTMRLTEKMGTVCI